MPIYTPTTLSPRFADCVRDAYWSNPTKAEAIALAIVGAILTTAALAVVLF